MTPSPLLPFEVAEFRRRRPAPRGGGRAGLVFLVAVGAIAAALALLGRCA